MIPRNMSLENFHIPSPTNLAYKLSGSIGDLAGENLFAILRNTPGGISDHRLYGWTYDNAPCRKDTKVFA